MDLTENNYMREAASPSPLAYPRWEPHQESDK